MCIIDDQLRLQWFEMVLCPVSLHRTALQMNSRELRAGVIALTALAMKEDREKTRAAGCDAYIVKPLRYKELYAAIDTLLAKGEPQAP